MAENERPFPLPASREQQEEWIQAAVDTPGVNVPREALANVAPFLVEPGGLLGLAGPTGRRRLLESTLRHIATDAGEATVVAVRMHGAGGVVWENNERISSAWHSPADPSGLTDQRRALARVYSWTAVNADGREEAYAALRSDVPSRAELIANVHQAAEALEKRVGHRPYVLKQDLVLNGQQEPGLFVAQQFQLEEPPLAGEDGRPLHPIEHWGWMAVRGNNRTKERHEIFGLSSAEVLTGVPLKKLGGEGETLVFDPSDWLARLSETLNEEYDTVDHWDPDNPLRAVQAKKVAVVEAHLVVGSPTPRRLYRIVQMSNRRDHVHPPLEFEQNDRSRAVARSVLGAYVAAGCLDERTAEVLSGAAPITDLPDAPSDASVSELRDLRSMMLLGELFPTDRDKQFLIRRALSESPPSQLSAPEVARRARAWSALTSESYPKAWNPRIGEMFQVGDVRGGIKLSGHPLRDLLASAETDEDAFEELVRYRAAHWLAAYGLIDADRGSLTGQKSDEDDGTEATRVRRTVRNALNALRNNSRIQAVAVLRELAKAMDQDRPPRKVSRSGELLYEPMRGAWFNREFPKETGKRLNKPPTPRAHPAQPPFTPGAGDGSPPATLTGDATPAEPPPVPPGLPSVPGTLPGFESTPTPEPQQAAGPDQTPETSPLPGAGPAPAPDGSSPLEQLADEVRVRVGRLLDETRRARETLDLVADKARQDDVRFVFSRGQADAIVREVPRTLRTLRELPELVEALAEPAE
ncbi:hypothetical protein ABT404_03655 [Streptomyces hyaluromycini]|uniref:PE-PGRS family protein n=1 Tax=Streptomyces hyaluromycini TaxID=1377993 RepID=A0ABV1WNZ2_9ACTN